VTYAIHAEGLRKRYRRTEALQGVDLAVRPGTVLGLLGPNGAGKTTVVRVLSTLLPPDGGQISVAGFNVTTHSHEVRKRIGLAGQYAAVDGLLTARENLIFMGKLLQLGRRGAARRADDLLARFELTDVADREVRTYSGGMRRRLDLASCLVVEPEVLFLDEPTTGLDPVSRMTLWTAVRDLVDRGVTVLLTTQYLEEADYLADQIVVVSAGRVIAEGTPDELKRKAGRPWLEVTLGPDGDLVAAVAAIRRATVGQPLVDEVRRTVSVQLSDGMDELASVAQASQALHDDKVAVADFALRRPTLDDVFFTLTA
jgi:ABC-2 type transport system ATP-binding protein